MQSSIRTPKSFIDQLEGKKMKIRDIVNEIGPADLIKGLYKNPATLNLPPNATYMQKVQAISNDRDLDRVANMVQKGWDMTYNRLFRANNRQELDDTTYLNALNSYLDKSVLSAVNVGQLNQNQQAMLRQTIKNVAVNRNDSPAMRQELRSMVAQATALAQPQTQRGRVDLRQTPTGVNVGNKFIPKSDERYQVLQDLGLAESINPKDVMPTVKWLEGVIDIPLEFSVQDSDREININIDSSRYNKNQIIRKLQANGYNQVDDYDIEDNTIKLKTPIRGSKLNPTVITNLMFKEKPLALEGLHEHKVQQILEGPGHIEHPEDLIFDQGTRGAEVAISLLNNLPNRSKEITIKWDGKPAIIWGRDPQGRFVLTDKSAFTAKGYDGLFKSPDELSTQLINRGPGREELAGVYKALWPQLEKQTPKDMKGYIQGDFLYIGKPPIKDGNYVFTPNTVTYSVPVDSKLGQEISASQAGVAVHTYKSDPTAVAVPMKDDTVKKLPKGSVLLLTPQMRQQPSLKIDKSKLQNILTIVSGNRQQINDLFNPQNLRDNKLANLPPLMKQYTNHKVRQGNFDNMAGGFLDFVKPKVSEPKYERMEKYIQEKQKAVATVFYIFTELAKAKTLIIRQLDQADDIIKASVGNEPGHEGYVIGGLKLVDRFRFSKMNFQQNNPLP